MKPNFSLQPTRYGMLPLASGNGLRPLLAGHSWHHAYARG